MHRRRYLPLLLLIGSLTAIYLSTLAPGLTWAHEGSDGGDLIAAAATGGIPHPTGYPLYLLLARAFQLLPIGSLAFRTNLLSAVSTILAAALVYLLVEDSSEPAASSRQAAALTAGYAFGLAPLIWSQALITEVYGLQVFLVALILYLYAKPAQVSGAPCTSRERLDSVRGLVLGLAMGNHLTTLLLVPAAFGLGALHSQTQTDRKMASGSSFWPANRTLDRGALWRQLRMFGAGLSIYLMIPFCALANPPVNWGNAVTLKRFWWLVSGGLYQSYYLQFSLTESWGRLQAGAGLLLEQFGLPAVALGFVGLILFGKRSRLLFLTIWTAGSSGLFAILYGSTDSYVYLMPALLCFAVWIGLGIRGLADRFMPSPSLMRIVLSVALVGYPLSRSIVHTNQLNASADRRAETFGRQVLSAAPGNALIFAEGDRAVFSLWYFHFALGERADVAIVAVDLLHFDWYQENLRATYPSLVVPGPFPWPETLASANPSRAVCYAGYSDRTELNCSQAPKPP